MSMLKTRERKREKALNFFELMLLSVPFILASPVTFAAENIVARVRTQIDSTAECLRVVAEQDFDQSPPTAVRQTIEQREKIVVEAQDASEMVTKIYIEYAAEGLEKCEWGGVRIAAYQDVLEKELYLGASDLCFRKPWNGPAGNIKSKEFKIRTARDENFDFPSVVSDVSDPLDITKPLWLNVCYKVTKNVQSNCPDLSSRLYLWERNEFSDSKSIDFPGAQIMAAELCNLGEK